MTLKKFVLRKNTENLQLKSTLTVYWFRAVLRRSPYEYITPEDGLIKKNCEVSSFTPVFVDSMLYCIMSCSEKKQKN